MTLAIDTLAGFVRDTRGADIPAQVQRRAADCILDALGAAAAGKEAAGTRAMKRALRPGSGAARVWFDTTEGDPATVAALNAMAATALDIDDGHRTAAGHPGAAVVAAALAAAPPELTGGDLLATVALGYEVSVRVALARMPEHHRSTVSGRWSGTGEVGSGAGAGGGGLPAVGGSAVMEGRKAERCTELREVRGRLVEKNVRGLRVIVRPEALRY